VIPIAQLVPHVVDALTDADAHDDVAVLALHWVRTPATFTKRDSRPSSASVALPNRADAPGMARQFVRDTLATSGLNGGGEVVELLTSEVVTNAVRHADSNMQVRVIRQPSSVRVEVDDDSYELPELRSLDAAAEHGRGILLIESLATEWGVDFRDAGKTVWFEVDLSRTADPQR